MDIRRAAVGADRDSALTLMMLLREEGHDVQALHSGRRVMATVLDFDPDVLILDVAMPELSGWEAAAGPLARLRAVVGEFVEKGCELEELAVRHAGQSSYPEIHRLGRHVQPLAKLTLSA